jgi:predicted nucleotidyltransferase component of viral defense system
MSEFNLHEDKDLFREAIAYTTSVTKFPQRLIEKDYYCSVILYFFSGKTDLVFKGGTCLAKVHANFYRLSEDLDFVIPMPVRSGRSNRRNMIKPIKGRFDKLEDELNIFRIGVPLTGANQSTQYIGTIQYNSNLSDEIETIKFEVSLREPLFEQAEMNNSRTILLNPINNQPMLPEIKCRCISKREAFAEKFRAALTRRDIAIRDYFDIDYAVRKLELNTEETKFIELVKKKLAVPGNDKIDAKSDRIDILRKQLDTELKPVLREEDFKQFDLERALQIVNEMKSNL